MVKGTLSNIALWRYVSRSHIWTLICEIIMTHGPKNKLLTQKSLTLFHLRHEYFCRKNYRNYRRLYVYGRVMFLSRYSLGMLL